VLLLFWHCLLTVIGYSCTENRFLVLELILDFICDSGEWLLANA
jgi:hypothetical protein